MLGFLGLMQTYILKFDSTASPEAAMTIAAVWEEVVNSIIEEMLAYANPYMDALHIDLREEMALELARLISFISEKVVIDRMAGRAIKHIDPKIEREQCFNVEGKNKISATARECAERIWLRKYLSTGQKLANVMF
jgi:hypothetical protein